MGRAALEVLCCQLSPQQNGRLSHGLFHDPGALHYVRDELEGTCTQTKPGFGSTTDYGQFTRTHKSCLAQLQVSGEHGIFGHEQSYKAKLVG